MLPGYEPFFTQLYQDNFWKLRRYAQVHLNPEQAEEVVQDTFHAALERIDLVTTHQNPSGWLMETLKNKIRNCQRANHKDLLRLVVLDTVMTAGIIGDESAEAALMQQEASQETKNTIKNALTEDERYIVKRLIFEKASHKEVAEELHISVWSSQKRLERIREKLDKMFPGHWRKK